MAQLNDDVLHVIFNHLDEMLDKHDPAVRRSTARAVCLASRRLLPLGRQLLYTLVTTLGPRAENTRSNLYRPLPGVVLRALSERRELGNLVEAWSHTERRGCKTEDDVLSIEKLDQACPRLRKLTISVLSWSEGGGEDNLSHLRRQVRALFKPFCTLAGRLRTLNIITFDAVPVIKLAKLFAAAVQLQTLMMSSFALGDFPRSATGPPSLTTLAVEGDLYSFLPLIQVTPSLKVVQLILEGGLDPLARGVKALSTPHVGVKHLHLVSIVQRAGTIDDPSATYQSINAFIESFPNVTSLRLSLTGDRMESTGIALDKVPRGLIHAAFGFDGTSRKSWNREDTAGPTAAEVQAWIKRGGAPRLRKLNIGLRATLEGAGGLQRTCTERGVVLKYELA